MDCMNKIYIEKNVLFDYDKFRKDVDDKNSKLKSKDGKSLSDRLDENGIGNYVFSNAITAGKRNAMNVDYNMYEDCERVGVLSTLRYNAVCILFGLDKDKYKLKLKNDIVTDKEESRIQDVLYYRQILQKSDEIISAINKLGNIEMQNMEYLKKIAKSFPDSEV